MLKSEILISKFETSTNVQNINLSEILENLMAIPIQCRRDIP